MRGGVLLGDLALERGRDEDIDRQLQQLRVGDVVVVDAVAGVVAEEAAGLAVGVERLDVEAGRRCRRRRASR